MKQANRSQLRKYIMTILYQINVYDKNKMTYDIAKIIKEVYPIENEFVNTMVYGVIKKKKRN